MSNDGFVDVYSPIIDQQETEASEQSGEDVVNTISVEPEIEQEVVTLESLAVRLDSLGAQVDWLCTNLASLFGFVQQMGTSGGGLRGIMKMLKSEGPELTQIGE